MKKFKIKLMKRRLGYCVVYDIVVSRVVNRNVYDSIETIGTYSTLYPMKYVFINVEKLSNC